MGDGNWAAGSMAGDVSARDWSWAMNALSSAPRGPGLVGMANGGDLEALGGVGGRACAERHDDVNCGRASDKRALERT